MTDAAFQKACKSMLKDIRKDTPRLTGNLAVKATKIKRLGANQFEIYVDEKIAPYFKYVNNAQTITYHKYRSGIVGKKITKRKDLPKVKRVVNNKNYQYFEKSVDKALVNLAEKVGGTLVHG
jgi:hypothetical protein